jgi:hypothetical protein
MALLALDSGLTLAHLKPLSLNTFLAIAECALPRAGEGGANSGGTPCGQQPDIIIKNKKYISIHLLRSEVERGCTLPQKNYFGRFLLPVNPNCMLKKLLNNRKLFIS